MRETPRVTKPYTEEQWQDILALGAAVDRALAAGDVRLTMGGEPTFVAASDFDEPEWTTDALGPTKQRFAAKLMQRLRERWAPGSALQNVSGKHYPGEQLPRWALLRALARGRRAGVARSCPAGGGRGCRYRDCRGRAAVLRRIGGAAAGRSRR